ncbi:MAG: ribonuclease III [Lachnospiraceae bacterium]|nr:ribonuclease III [Lachnospiraceae bacterium]
MDLEKLERRISVQFRDKELLAHAMRHSSFANEHQMGARGSNERLEFLGDAVLELVTSEFLYEQYPQMEEGDATKMRASIVCEPSLAFCAKEIPIGDYIQLGRGEEVSGGRQRASITSDALEALIGAIYLDRGFETARDFIHRFILQDLEHKKLFFDSKTILQEHVQAAHEGILHYELVKEEGPDHCKQFTVQAMLGERVIGTGSGRTKKAAEQEAAYFALTEEDGRTV